MPSRLQERLADNIVKNLKSDRPLSKRQLVLKSGYNRTVADSKANITIENKGVKKILKKKYNIDETQVRNRLGEFLSTELDQKEIKPDHVLRAIENTARILGMNAPEKHVVLTGDLMSLLSDIEKEKTKDMSSSEAEK